MYSFQSQVICPHIRVSSKSGVQVICTKVRDGDKRIVRLKEGEPKGRHVVIIDDLVQSGGTLIECQKLLKTQVLPLLQASQERIRSLDGGP